MCMKRVKGILLSILLVVSIGITGCGGSSKEQNGNNNNVSKNDELLSDAGVPDDYTPTDNVSADEKESRIMDIDKVLGEKIDYETVFGIEYALYDSGVAVVDSFNAEDNIYGEIQKEIEVDGIKYPVIGLGTVNKEWTEFEIPSHIKYILDGAFENSKIKEIKIPDTVEYVSGQGTFKNTEIESFSLPEGVKTSSEWASMFTGCHNLRTVEIPYGVKKIGGFYKTKITTISIPDSVTTIKGCAFEGCTLLEEIEIPDSVTYIGEIAFKDCVKLKEIKLPSKLKTLSLSFAEGTMIEEIIVPDTVTKYGSDNFDYYIDNMPYLKSFKCSKNVNKHVWFSNCPKLELIILPDNVEDWSYFANEDEVFEKVITLQVPANAVDYMKQKFPNCNVIAKE